MRFDTPIHVTAARTWLPERRVAVEQAVADGLLDTRSATRDGYTEIPVSDTHAAPEMAVLAARKALADAGTAATDLALVAHAWTYHQGHDFWSPAHYLARELGADGAIPVGVQQMCNGGATAIDLAATRMIADPTARTVLVTTADRFEPPGFDRWMGDYGIAYGDGATALVLSTEPGPYRLVASTTVCAPDLELMHRGHDAFSSAARGNGDRVDVRRTKKAYMADHLGPDFAETAGASVRAVIGAALSQAGLAADAPSIRLIALPRLGRTVLDQAYLPAIGGLTEHGAAEPLDLGRATGHLGAGDAAANLAGIHEAGLLEPGQIALLLSAGGGFSWTCLVLMAS